jgi:hypothetical protein
MKLIIQIPCFNEEEFLPATLAALPRAVEGFDAVERLIVDDGSSDRGREESTCMARLGGTVPDAGACGRTRRLSRHLRDHPEGPARSSEQGVPGSSTLFIETARVQDGVRDRT